MLDIFFLHVSLISSTFKLYCSRPNIDPHTRQISFMKITDESSHEKTNN